MKPYQEVSDPTFLPKLAEIQRLLAEAYEHYFATGSHCKSLEGAISIHLPEFFWDDGQPSYGAQQRPGLEIYSYCLGPSRSHYFANIDEALKAVRRWHKAEMSEVT